MLQILLLIIINYYNFFILLLLLFLNDLLLMYIACITQYFANFKFILQCYTGKNETLQTYYYTLSLMRLIFFFSLEHFFYVLEFLLE